ncbi:MAG: hypothetical protein FJ304_00605 [Planctomycetes bacterium]|nr:hypothetical protein [Planctomycetota bacterium]
MAQGTRRRLVRLATASFGVLLSTSLVGCLNWDKSKDTKKNNQPTPGLYGTPTIPPGGQPPVNNTGAFKGPGGNLQNTGAPRQPSNGFNTNTGNYGQPVDYRGQPGGPTPFGTPGIPGAQPPVFGSNPPPPSLPLDGIYPPGPPPYSPPGAPAGGGFGVDVQPIAPPTAPPGAAGKGWGGQ